MTHTALRAARVALGMTQEAFARDLGVSTRTLSRWETGAYRIPAWVELVLKTRQRAA